MINFSSEKNIICKGRYDEVSAFFVMLFIRNEGKDIHFTERVGSCVRCMKLLNEEILNLKIPYFIIKNKIISKSVKKIKYCKIT